MNYLLFTTTTCPKCPAVKQFIADNISFTGELIDNTRSDFMDLAQKFGVTQAPTFILLQQDQELFRGSEICEIQDFLKQASL